MTNKSQAIGTEWETRLTALLRRVWPHAERRAKQGAFDKGDFYMTNPFCIEAKAEKKITLGTYMNETEVERRNSGARWGACIIKRRNHNVKRAYVVMELEPFLEVVELALDTLDATVDRHEARGAA